MLSYLGGTVSMLAATFIVFSSLSMGVTERQRTLAMLRAIGAFAVAARRGWCSSKGCCSALLGVLVGVPLGILASTCSLAWKFSELFTAGVVVELGRHRVRHARLRRRRPASPSILPAWTRCASTRWKRCRRWQRRRRPHVPLAQSLVGLRSSTIDPLLVFGAVQWLLDRGNRRRARRRKTSCVLRPLCARFAGADDRLLPARAAVRVARRAPAGPVVAAMFGLRYAMLRQQLSGGIWRAAGTCAALMVGLAILVVMQTQGNSAAAGWRLPDKFPDVFITGFKPGGLDAAEQKKIAQVEGIRIADHADRCISPTQLGQGVLRLRGRRVLPDATMFFGVDPDKAFDMMELDFSRQGKATEGASAARRRRKCSRRDGTSSSPTSSASSRGSTSATR